MAENERRVTSLSFEDRLRLRELVSEARLRQTSKPVPAASRTFGKRRETPRADSGRRGPLGRARRRAEIDRTPTCDEIGQYWAGELNG